MHSRIHDIRKSLGLSQSDFGARIGLSRDSIANIEGNRTEIKDVVIKLICREFNIDEEWLRTGEGEMYSPQTRNQEIIEFANQVMAEEDESFRKRFVTALAKAKPEFWDELDKILDEALKKD